MKLNEIIAAINLQKQQKRRTQRVEMPPIETALKCWQQIGEAMQQGYEMPTNAARFINWLYCVDGGFGDDLQKGIMLRGNTGVGKTFLFDVAQQFGKLDELFVCTKVNARDISAQFAKPNGWNVIDEYAHVPFLLIDDIGAEPITQNYGCKVSPITEIIDRREELGKITHATTNVLELGNVYDDRTLSRMYSLFNVWTINENKDYRRK